MIFVYFFKELLIVFQDNLAEETLNKYRCELGTAYKIAEACMLLEFFLSKTLITRDEEEYILAEKTSMNRMDKLIDYVCRRMTREKFKIFVDAVGDGEIVNNPGLKELLIQYYERNGGNFSR